MIQPAGGAALSPQRVLGGPPFRAFCEKVGALFAGSPFRIDNDLIILLTSKRIGVTIRCVCCAERPPTSPRKPARLGFQRSCNANPCLSTTCALFARPAIHLSTLFNNLRTLVLPFFKASCFFSARCALFAQKAGGRGLPIFSSATGHGTRIADHVSVFFCISRTVPQRSASFSGTSGFRTEKKGGGRGYPHTDSPSRFGTRLADGLASPRRQCTPTISGRSRLPRRQTSAGPWPRRRGLSSSCIPDTSGA